MDTTKKHTLESLQTVSKKLDKLIKKEGKQDKVILCMPPVSIEEHYGRLKDSAPQLPQIGLYYVKKAIEKQGYSVEILDLSKLSYPTALANLYQRLSENNCKALGCTVQITSQTTVKQLMSDIKENYNTLITFVGGSQVTLNPEYFKDKHITFGVVGESETAIGALLDHFIHEQDIQEITGCFYWENGEWVLKTKKKLVANLDEVGYVDIPDQEDYVPSIQLLGKKIINVMASRGCPFKCVFCAAGENSNRRIRYRSVENVEKEIRERVKKGYDSFIFYDDTFTIDKKRVMLLCTRMKVIGRDFNKKLLWSCFTRTDLVNDNTMLWLMKDSGCYLITFGCESSHDKTLTLLKKGVTAEQQLEGITQVEKAGIMTASTFMLGLPNETSEDMEATIDYAKNSDLTFAYFPMFEPYYGTPIYNLCNDYGKWIMSSTTVHDQKEMIWQSNSISVPDLKKLSKIAHRKFYLTPNRLYKIYKNDLRRMTFERKMRFIKAGLSYFTYTKDTKKSARY